MDTRVKKFLEQVTGAYGANLLSVILYGSQASGEAVGKQSDYNLLIILKQVDVAALGALRGCIHSWTKHGNMPPLIFSKDMLLRSCDVFPIEFLDIKEKHTVLFGEDPFPQLEIHLNNLRHECEFELKGKLLKLRQGYMAAADDHHKIRTLLTATVTPFLVVFRHVLRFYGEIPPLKNIDALEKLAPRCGVNPDVFSAVLHMKAGEKQYLHLDAETTMHEYIEQIQTIVDCVDQLTPGGLV